jgi:hypothetical protein
MYPGHLRAVIVSALFRHLGRGAASAAAVELLMLTAATESRLGTYLYQLQGPAIGIFQMEPKTHDDLQARRVIGRHKNIPLADASRMAWDLAYAAVMARIYYMQFVEPLPAADDIPGMAEYWKEYYNTEAGAGTPEKAIADYERYVLRL